MANPEHLAILKQGVDVWNQWRQQNSGMSIDFREANLYGLKLEGADFYGTNFYSATLTGAMLNDVNLYGANLNRTILRDATLTRAILTGAKLSNANLAGANLEGADIQGALLVDANLEGAILTGANLQGANLEGTQLQRVKFNRANLQGATFNSANFQGATFWETNLRGATLTEADVTQAVVGFTVFGDLDLRTIHGLATVQHAAPSTIGIDTLYRSHGQIPEVFLRGCGVPDSMIEYARALVAAEQPIDYYSVFISYSSKDEELAKRLHADLQAAGVRCWYAPENLKIGESILGGIDQGIRLHDKLLLLLSESSVNSAWVDAEVHMALVRERSERRRVLFPVRIDDAVLTSGASWAALVRGDYHIGDFRQWKAHDSYQAAFSRLLRDLKAKQP